MGQKIKSMLVGVDLRGMKRVMLLKRSFVDEKPAYSMALLVG